MEPWWAAHLQHGGESEDTAHEAGDLKGAGSTGELGWGGGLGWGNTGSVGDGAVVDGVVGDTWGRLGGLRSGLGGDGLNDSALAAGDGEGGSSGHGVGGAILDDLGGLWAVGGESGGGLGGVVNRGLGADWVSSWGRDGVSSRSGRSWVSNGSGRDWVSSGSRAGGVLKSGRGRVDGNRWVSVGSSVCASNKGEEDSELHFD